MQKFIATGNLTKEPEITETSGGHTVARFSIAVRREYKNADGEYSTDFLNCVTWNSTAKFAEKYCKKGQKILIEGSVENREYTDRNGEKRRVTEIQVQNIELLSPKAADTDKPTGKPSDKLIQSFDDDGDIPF